MKFTGQRHLWCAAMLLLIARGASAQSGTAMLSGTVKDETGSVVPDVMLTLTNAATQLRLRGASDSTGLFMFPLLPRGEYVLTTDRPGFSPIEVPDLTLNVNDRLHITVVLKVASIGETVQVAADSARVNTSPALSTVIDRQFVENLPLNGRSFQSLLAVTPGIVFTGQSSAGGGQFSVNGQRTNANYFMVDGVGANVESSGAHWPGQEAAGVTPALNAVGGTQSLLSVDALEEFSIQTSTYTAQFGRQPGAQVSLVSRAGTNTLSGSLFEYFRDDAMDATNWFVKANGLPRTELRQNQFGGTLGGPVRFPKYDGRNRTFFFFAYERLRLLQPRTVQYDVPSLSLREEAWPALQPLLASLPVPTGPEDPTSRQAPFVAAYSAPSSYHATSLRLDHHLSPTQRVFGRFNISPSEATSRDLNNVRSDQGDLRSTTAGLTQTFGATLTHDLRFNETSNKHPFETWQDGFGGATPVSYRDLLPPSIPSSTPVRLQVHLHGVASPYFTIGQYQRQRQLNVVDTWTWTKGNHLFKFGGDYRWLAPASQPWEYFYFIQFNQQAVLTGIPSGGSIQALERVDIRVQNFAAFMQDTWRVGPRLTLDLGVRWDVNPAPTLTGERKFTTVEGIDRPETLRLAPAGAPLYPTDYGAVAPRLGAAYVMSDRPGWERVLRGGVGRFQDIGAGMAAQAAIFFPFERRKLPPNAPYPFTAEAVAPPLHPNLDPPYDGQKFVAFPDHRTPWTYEWNATIEQSLGRSQSLTASYVGAAGRHLLRLEEIAFTNPNPDFTGTTLLKVNRSNSSSDYKALQLEFRRRLSRGLQVLSSYTLSKAEDTASNDSIVQPRADRIDPGGFRGPSEFDRRHVFSAAITYSPPAPAAGLTRAALRDWSVSAIVQVQSAAPVNVAMHRDLGFGSLSTIRPDRVPGEPLYLDDPTAPGGWRFNPAAFSVPVEPRMGNLPRNALRGFPLRQIDLSLARSIGIGSGARVQLRADVFNLFNAANFGSPSGHLGSVDAQGVLTPSSGFGRATSTIDSSFGGLNGLYRLFATGGPRSVQLSARLTF
jgi:hypothetical protein